MANVITSTEIRDVARVAVTLKPAWLRIPDACKYSGIGRSSLYDLLAENRIKSASIKKRGNIRGIRLISAESLDTYLESIAEGGSNPVAA